MLIERLQVRGLLSFGPDGVDLPLEPLNVLIGPNGAGKSNLLKTFGLLQSAPTDISKHANETGTALDWFWEQKNSRTSATIEVTTAHWQNIGANIHHTITIRPLGCSFHVSKEEVSHVCDGHRSILARTNARGPVYKDYEDTPFGNLWCLPSQSLVCSIGNEEDIDWPDEYDSFRMFFLQSLKRIYGEIQLHQDWSIGNLSPVRNWQDTVASNDRVAESGNNLASVLSGFSPSLKQTLEARLNRFYDGITGIGTPVSDGKISVFVEESEGRMIPAGRLSDGTLRYLNLLAILLNPNPPALIGIEEPELGLHPDVIYDLAELLVEASARTQLVVTTHSPTLINALTDHPTSVVACGKHQGQTWFKRVTREALEPWIDEHSLGEVWSMGGIGGNRW